MTENETLQEFVNRLGKQESERAAERARQEMEYLAMAIWRIENTLRVKPEVATRGQYNDVKSGCALLSDRIRRNDHGIDERVLLGYVEKATRWLDNVIGELFEQAGR